jgi:transcriptional regulator with XRE-family HTH domain
MNETGGELRTLRLAARLTLWDVAGRLGWTATYLSEIERGIRGDKPERDAKIRDTIRAIARERAKLLREL